jgi:hypothetical protein
MKKIVLFSAALALVASAAFAGGIDLSTVACPDNPGATSSATLDCAGGVPVTVLITWSPNENITQLASLQGLMEIGVGGDLNSAAGFWNFDPAGCNPGALTTANARPSSGCATAGSVYPNTFSGGISGQSTANRSSTTEEVAWSVARASAGTANAGTRQFGMQLTVDASTSAESGGGSCTGCTLPACLYQKTAKPGSFDNNEDASLTKLETPTGFGASQTISNLFTFNGGVGQCAAVPVKKNTWGQLKSLYR